MAAALAIAIAVNRRLWHLASAVGRVCPAGQAVEEPLEEADVERFPDQDGGRAEMGKPGCLAG